MHLRELLIQNCKLMHQLEVSFVRQDGSPRPWTVFVGENGTCKTTLLRAIAMSAAGSAFSNSLVSEPAAYPDRRSKETHAIAEASFGFSAKHHAARTYPKVGSKIAAPPEVVSRIEIGMTAVRCRANYGTWDGRAAAIGAPEAAVAAVAAQWAARAAAAAAQSATAADPALAAALVVEASSAALGAEAASKVSISTPIEDARDQSLPLWFTAAYGMGRVLASPQSQTEGQVPARDRMRSLFDARHLPLGTGFSDVLARTFGEDRARAFARCLRTALVERMATPKLKNVELRGHGGANSQLSLIESHRFAMQVGKQELKLPAVWLSQGYQAVVSLIADIIGNVWLESGGEVELDDMEGIVLIDELDLHLHPTWQTQIVRGLKATFPNMQFVVTTHSPLVLAGCKSDEVWTLKQDEDSGDVTAEMGDASPMVMTGSELNREFFGVRRASPLSEDLRRYVELASNAYRSEEDDSQMRVLLQTLRDNEIPVDYEPVARKTAP